MVRAPRGLFRVRSPLEELMERSGQVLAGLEASAAPGSQEAMAAVRAAVRLARERLERERPDRERPDRGLPARGPSA